MRSELSTKMRDFDREGKTDVNFDGAAIAGAKVVLAEGHATRRFTKKLANEVGVSESDLLYKVVEELGMHFID